MSKRIKSHHPTFKFKVVLDSFIKGNVAEVARKYSVNHQSYRPEDLKY